MITLWRKISFPSRSESGMTLLEVMLAIVMLAAVMSMVSISISGSFNIIDATEKRGEAYYRAQVALQRISEDLASALLLEGIEFNGQSTDNDGERGNLLEFTSTAHIVFDQESDHPGIALISYRLAPDKENENELVLLRSDTLLRSFDTEDEFGGDDWEGFLLCDRLRSVKLSYIDDEGEIQDTWTSQLEDTDEPGDRKLPVSVTVTLELWLDRDKETSMEFMTGVLLPAGLLNAEIDPEQTGG